MMQVGFEQADVLPLEQAIQKVRSIDWHYTIVATPPLNKDSAARIFVSSDEKSDWQREGYVYFLDKVDMDPLLDAATHHGLNEKQSQDLIIYYAIYDADPPWLGSLIHSDRSSESAKGDAA